MASATTAPPPRRIGLPLRTLSDERLARLAAGGDRDALAAIFERHHQALYRYCRALLGSAQDAEDALQNAMARVVRGLPGESRQLALKPWLYRIAHNEAMRIAGRRRPQAALEDAQEVAARPETEAREMRERLSELLADLRELSERQRGALVLRELEGASFAHIASVFGGSEAAAKQTVYEARVCLADFARGRDMGCEAVTRALSDGDRRRLRGRPVRAHLRACQECRAFQAALRQRPKELGALAPPLGAPAAAALLAKLTGGAGGLGAASASSSGLASIALPSLVLKGLATVAVAAGVTAGVVEVVPSLPGVGDEPAALAEDEGGSGGGDRGGEREAVRDGEKTARGGEEAPEGEDGGARGEGDPRAGARGAAPARQAGRERSGTARVPTSPADRLSRRDPASGGSVDFRGPDPRDRGRGDGARRGAAPGGEPRRPAPPVSSRPAPSRPGGAPGGTAPSPAHGLPVPAVPSLPDVGDVARPGVLPEAGARRP